MLSIFDSVSELLAKGDTASALGKTIGVEGDTAQQAASTAAPLLLGGLADRAKQPGGSAAVMGMLDDVDRSSVDGAGLLDGIFDNRLAGVVENLAGSTGLGVGTIAKLLPTLAPMVMGVVAKRRMADGLDGTGLTNLLIGEQAKLERDGFLSSTGGSIGKVAGAAAAGGAVLGGGVAAASGKLGQVGDVASGATGKVGGVASGATGKLGAVGDVATNGVGKIGGTVSGGVGRVGDVASGGVGKVGGAVSGGVGRVGDVASGGVGKVGGTVSGGASKLGGTVAGGAGAVGGAVPSVGGSGGRFGKFGWILGAIVAVVLAAWALSQCGGGDAVDTATGAIDDAAETVEETVEEVTEEAAEVVDEVVEEVVDYQPGVDAALAASGVAGVSGVIDANGVVNLTGEVDSDEARQAAEDAAAGADGVTSVNNQITVAAAAVETETPAAGSTINDILDLDPITFAVNSADITAEGQAVLGSAVEFMTANSTIFIEIAGHTDSDGSDASNEALSQSRADSVKAFLVSNGVEAERMTTKGYGESVPKVENDTPENKAINRRIEFTVQ